MKVRITFTEPLLGTQPANKELHTDYIASKAPDAMTRTEEIEAMGAEEVESKAMTIFPRTEDDIPFLWDYQWKGFFKESCSMLHKIKYGESGKMTAFKKLIDGTIFVYPRKIPVIFDGNIRDNQRPLRASTPQGERIAIAHSEEIPAGATCELEIECLCKDHEKAVREWLDYGAKHGTGQWRNASYGRFEWAEITEATV